MKESQKTEFKKSLAERREILETISAFANSEGGKGLVTISGRGRGVKYMIKGND